MRAKVELALAIVVCLAAVRAAWLGIEYVLGIGGTARHHLESAWFAFVAVGLVAALHSASLAPGHAVRQSFGATRSLVLGTSLCAASLALYWPALHVGFLSDDFQLVSFALNQTLVPSEWQHVRPLPLLVWHVAGWVWTGDSLAAALHASNIVLHAVNALLVSLIAARLGCVFHRAACAGAVFLVFPLSVEPVVWLSGIFDLTLVTFSLGAVLAALAVPSVGIRAAVVLILAGLALASKETAVILPMLVGLSLWLARGRAADYRPVLPALALVSIYIVWWVLVSELPPSHRHLPSGYELKELLGRPFAALTLPYHASLLAEVKALSAAELALLPVCLGALALRGNGWQLAVLAWATVWTLVSVAPLSTAFFVGADLQGSRYLYLAASAWSIALPLIIPSFTRSKEIYVTGTALACAISAVMVRVHLQPWQDACALRDRVMAAYEVQSARCEPFDVTGLPDTNEGAYVFRNGFREAVGLLADRPGRASDPARPPCSLEWAGDRFAATSRRMHEP